MPECGGFTVEFKGNPTKGNPTEIQRESNEQQSYEGTPKSKTTRIRRPTTDDKRSNQLANWQRKIDISTNACLSIWSLSVPGQAARTSTNRTIYESCHPQAIYKSLPSVPPFQTPGAFHDEVPDGARQASILRLQIWLLQAASVNLTTADLTSADLRATLLVVSYYRS